jgi:hypothetical protein
MLLLPSPIHILFKADQEDGVPHDGCGSVVAYNELHDHAIACPHGQCDCTEAGCNFAASPAALVAHLREINSIRVDMIPYGTAMAFIWHRQSQDDRSSSTGTMVPFSSRTHIWKYVRRWAVWWADYPLSTLGRRRACGRSARRICGRSTCPYLSALLSVHFSSHISIGLS